MNTLERLSNRTPTILYRGEIFKIIHSQTYEDSPVSIDKLQEKLYPYRMDYVASLSQCTDEIGRQSSRYETSEVTRLKNIVAKYKLINESLLPLFEPGMGVYEHDEQFYVFLDTGYYILYDHPSMRDDYSDNKENYYLFSPARIGVKLGFSGRTMSVENILVMNRYAHPFLRDTSSMQRICMGNWGYEKRDRELNKLSEERKIIYTLKKARQILQSGYKPGCTPHHNLSYLTRSQCCQKITKEKALTSGIPITNLRG